VNTLRQKLAAATRSKAAPTGAEPRFGLELEAGRDTFNPYGRIPTEHAAAAKRDLRKLSEWIKMMRTLEARVKSPAD